MKARPITVHKLRSITRSTLSRCPDPGPALAARLPPPPIRRVAHAAAAPASRRRRRASPGRRALLPPPDEGFLVMATPVNQDSITPVNTWEEEELELEEEECLNSSCFCKGLLCKRKRAKFSDSTVRQQQGIEAAAMDMVMEEAAALSLGVSASKEPVHVATGRVEQSNCGAKHANGTTDNEPARLRLHKICSATHWKEPSYDFEEQGPSHLKLFTCKVTIHVDTFTTTIVECISEPKRSKKAAQEHAAQGALWYLKIFGHAN
uniref:DRBM domain-containing protein n=1 Tax=Oryza nivara TaxID=4536 RepID=A0A0E0IJJ9_ORYNI